MRSICFLLLACLGLTAFAQPSSSIKDSLNEVIQQASLTNDTALHIRALNELYEHIRRSRPFGQVVQISEGGRDTLLVQLAHLQANYGYDILEPFHDKEGIFLTGINSLGLDYFCLPHEKGNWPIDSVVAHASDFVLVETPSVDSLPRWIKLRLRNSDSLPRQATLRFSAAQPSASPWDRLYLYRKDTVTGRYQIDSTGWARDVPGKALPLIGNYVQLELPAQSSQWVYAQVHPPKPDVGGRAFSVAHLDFNRFLYSKERMDLYSGIFLGILLIQGVYYLLLFGATRDASFGYYVLFILGLMGLTLVFGGFFDRITPTPQQLINIMTPATPVLCSYGLMMFSHSFLSTPSYQPLRRRTRRIFMVILPSAILVPFLGVYLSGVMPFDVPKIIPLTLAILFVILFPTIFISGIVLSVVMSIRSVRRGYAPARPFLLSQVLLLLGVLMPILIIVMMGSSATVKEVMREVVTPSLFLGFMGISVILQLSLMALGIGQKRRLLEKEKLATEQALNRELTRTNDAFARFVPHEFLKAIGRETVLEVSPGDGVEREVTVLFSDIRGYTTLSEQMTPNETFRFLNQYLAKVGPVVREYGGFVNQFFGDGIMALFPQAPVDAVAAGIAMQRAIEAYNDEQDDDGPTIRVGIGLHSGPLMMGVIGERNRLDAGVVADAVNTAARMEGLTKHYGSSLLISESVWDYLSQPVHYEHRFVAKVQVKGRRQPLAIYDIFAADPPEIRALKTRTLPDFTKGVEAFLAREFSAAVAAFEAVLAVHAGDLAAQRYVRFAKQYQRVAPPADWAGVDMMQEK